MSDYPLPSIIQSLANVIGRHKALQLVGQLPRTKQVKSDGRTRWRIYANFPKPQNLKRTHKLAQILGFDDALKLCSMFGGEIVSIPSCNAMYKDFLHRSIRNQYLSGVSLEILVIIFGMNRKSLNKIIS